MLSLKIALRYFISRKSHGAVNVISLISVAGVAVATAATVCVLSVFNGFTELALSRTSLVDPPVKMLPREGKTIEDASALIDSIRMLVPEVGAAYPVIEEDALATYTNRQMPVTIKGVPEGYNSVVDYSAVTIDSLDERPLDVPSALLSVGVSLRMEARPNVYYPFVLFTPRRVGRINPNAPLGAFRSDSLAVWGVYQAEEQSSDATRVIVPISTARKLLDYEDEATAIELVPAEGVSVDETLAALRQEFGTDYIVLDRVMQQEDAFRMINIEKWVTFAMLAFILLIAAFNIISTLAMLVIEKERDAETLRILGATQRRISAIFTAEGALITMAGGVIGIIAGTIISFAQQLTGFVKLSGDPAMMIIDHYPVKVVWWDLLAVLGIVAVIACLTSLIARFMAPRLKLNQRGESHVQARA